MGCCYGMGALGQHLGAEVSKRRYGEKVAAVPCTKTEAGRADPLLVNLPDRFDAFVGHKEALQEIPEGAVHLMSGDGCPYQMIRYGQNVYATQFHPEADADGVAVRIRAYRDKGYFPPEEAEPLIAAVADADVVGAGEEVSDLLPRVLGIVRSLIAFARFGSLRAIACMCMPCKWEMNNELDVIRTPVRSRVTGDDEGGAPKWSADRCRLEHR